MINVAFLLILVAASAHAQCRESLPTCRYGWTYHYGSCYGFGTVPLSWADAAATCTAHGGYLVEIQTAEENTWLVNTIRNFGMGSIWIGASEMLSRGSIAWAHSGNRLTFTDWAPGQPADPPGLREDCIEIRAPFEYKWNDFQCLLANNYVCETKPIFPCL